jgi:hypothetical protein
MHERYFYLADVLTVLSAFYLPRKLWALPILEQFASLLSYLPFLLMTGGTRVDGRRGSGFPGGSGRFPAGGFPGGNGGNAGQPPSLPVQGTGNLPGGAVGGGGTGGFGGGRGGIGGAPTNSVVSFTVLATAMLLALLLVLWVTVREFRRVDPLEVTDGTNPAPPVDGRAESTFGTTSDSAEKPGEPADPTAESTGRPVAQEGQVWGSR